jgi:hypothetical protein
MGGSIMRSYLEIIKELSNTVGSDNIPSSDREKITALIQQLMDVLWKYSD